MSSVDEKVEDNKETLISKTLEKIHSSLGLMNQLVRTKPKASQYWETIIDELEISPNPTGVGLPKWNYVNERSTPIAIKRISFIFDRRGAAARMYVPNVKVTIDGREIVRPHKNLAQTFIYTNLNIDLKNGIELKPYDRIEVFAWSEKNLDPNNNDKKNVTLTIDFGEA